MAFIVEKAIGSTDLWGQLALCMDLAKGFQEHRCGAAIMAREVLKLLPTPSQVLGEDGTWSMMQRPKLFTTRQAATQYLREALYPDGLFERDGVLNVVTISEVK